MASEPVCAPIEGVDPVFIPHMLKGAMACRYCRAANLTIDEGYDAAVATWETEWPDDPEPRTFEGAMEVVSDDLAYWTED